MKDPEPLIIAELYKNQTETVRVTRERFHGYEIVQCRVWVSDDGKAAKPTKKGLALRVDMVAKLCEALTEAAATEI